MISHFRSTETVNERVVDTSAFQQPPAFNAEKNSRSWCWSCEAVGQHSYPTGDSDHKIFAGVFGRRPLMGEL